MSGAGRVAFKGQGLGMVFESRRGRTRIQGELALRERITGLD